MLGHTQTLLHPPSSWTFWRGWGRPAWGLCCLCVAPRSRLQTERRGRSSHTERLPASPQYWQTATEQKAANINSECSRIHNEVWQGFDPSLTVPLVSERVVHAVEDDENALILSGDEERHGLFVQGVSAMKQGDGREIHRTQLSQTAACCLWGERFVFVRMKTMKRPRNCQGSYLIWYPECRLLRGGWLPAYRAAAGWGPASQGHCWRVQLQDTEHVEKKLIGYLNWDIFFFFSPCRPFFSSSYRGILWAALWSVPCCRAAVWSAPSAPRAWSEVGSRRTSLTGSGLSPLKEKHAGWRSAEKSMTFPPLESLRNQGDIFKIKMTWIRDTDTWIFTCLSVNVPVLYLSVCCTDRSSLNSGRLGKGSNLLMAPFSFCWFSITRNRSRLSSYGGAERRKNQMCTNPERRQTFCISSVHVKAAKANHISRKCFEKNLINQGSWIISLVPYLLWDGRPARHLSCESPDDDLQVAV